MGAGAFPSPHWWIGPSVTCWQMLRQTCFYGLPVKEQLSRLAKTQSSSCSCSLQLKRSGVMKFQINMVDLLCLRMDERTQSFCTDRFFLQQRDNRVTVRVLIRHGADFA